MYTESTTDFSTTEKKQFPDPVLFIVYGRESQEIAQKLRNQHGKHLFISHTVNDLEKAKSQNKRLILYCNDADSALRIKVAHKQAAHWVCLNPVKDLSPHGQALIDYEVKSKKYEEIYNEAELEIMSEVLG